jgi:hypothetical protein
VAAVVILAVVLTDSNAFVARHPRYTVDSQMIHYGDSNLGSGPPWAFAAEPESPLVTSYNDEGSEVILSWTSPDHPLEATLWKARLVLSGLHDHIGRRILSFVERLNVRNVAPPAENEDVFAVVYPTRIDTDNKVVLGRRAPLLISGCRPSFRGWEVIGQDRILDYPTTVVREEFRGGRTTLWMAPELSCFALRATTEHQQPDGTWMLMTEKNALKVTINR